MVTWRIFSIFSLHNKAKNNLTTIKIAAYKVENRIVTLRALNPNIKIITKRDTVPPKIDIIQTGNQNELQYKISDDNFKSAWYSIDDGEKIAIGQEGTIQLNLDEKTRKITIGSDDYFRLKGERITYRNITGINDLVNRALKFYPNPATNYINIDLPQDMKDATIEMHSMDGKQVMRLRYDQSDTRINVQNLNKGVYLISIQGRDKTGIFHSEISGIMKLN